MYRCKECGAEYNEKPDYCDCGNDEFEMVAVNQTVAGINTAEEKKESQKTINEKLKPQPAEARIFNKSAQSLDIPKRELNIDPISLIIFGLCIFLSLYVIFFAWNPKENEVKTEIEQEVGTLKNIPTIDKIWNNALPVVKKEEPKSEEKVENFIKQIIPVQTIKKVETPKKVQTTTQQKVTKIPLTKTVPTQKKINGTTKQTTATKQQATVSVQEQTKKQAEAEAAKQKAEAEKKAAEAAQLKKLQEEQAKKAAEEKARQTQIAKQEYISYKANLRNTIARKIDFTRVIGDGSCTVSFKIDSNGNLYSRSFTKQSSNNTLNDAVYNAIMSTPTFNPPPTAYNSELLNLNIRFYNGNFEISLP